MTAGSAAPTLTRQQFQQAAQAALEEVWKSRSQTFTVHGMKFGLSGIRSSYESAAEYIETNGLDMYEAWLESREEG